ncbi:MAG TPA: HlyD family efflux transporter periplasmic adaptor subunit [Bryobacteraceae bacterium]
MVRKIVGRFIGALIVLGAIAAVLLTMRRVGMHPQTSDAEVFANLIGIAPEVYGRIIRIDVKDNQYVHKGDLLFEIDPLPYRYALETAQSQQATLEGQIKDLERAIGAETSAVVSAQAHTVSAQARVASMQAAVEAAQASINAAKAELSSTEADYAYAEGNVLRLEPLLVKKFVSVDMVDQARTSRSVKGEAVRQARSRLAAAQAEWASAAAQQNEAQAAYQQSRAQADQAVKSVTLLEPLIAQRQGREAAVKNAAYYLERCKVYAPFDARVTNLTISEGAYAHVGQQAFTLIDTRTWWVIANFREKDLRRIAPRMKADVYVMSNPAHRFLGTIDSTGFGVTPDPSLVGSPSQGLPDVQRSLNWVLLATRFPVRVRIDQPAPDEFRIGASAEVIVRNDGK